MDFSAVLSPGSQSSAKTLFYSVFLGRMNLLKVHINLLCYGVLFFASRAGSRDDNGHGLVKWEVVWKCIKLGGQGDKSRNDRRLASSPAQSSSELHFS